MLVHVAVCGMGLGHVTRSHAIAEELIRKGHQVYFTSYGQALDYLRRYGFNSVAVPEVGYGVSHDGGVSIKKTIIKNMLLPLVFLAQTSAEYSTIVSSNPALVLSDTRASAVLAANLAGKPVATVINQYNVKLETRRFKRVARFSEYMLQAPQLIWNSSDALIIPDLPPPYTISEKTLNLDGKALSKAHYVGPIANFRMFDEGLKNKMRIDLGVDGRKLVAVVLSGGTDEKRFLFEKFMGVAPHLTNQYLYVVSAANPAGNRSFKVGPVLFFDWFEAVDLLLQAADLVVCRSGLTLIHKCIAFGKKALLIPTPGHGEQMGNAAKAQSLGVAKVLSQESLSADLFCHMVEEALADERMAACVERVRKVLLGLDGVKRVTAVLEDLLLNVS